MLAVAVDYYSQFPLYVGSGPSAQDLSYIHKHVSLYRL